MRSTKSGIARNSHNNSNSNGFTATSEKMEFRMNSYKVEGQSKEKLSTFLARIIYSLIPGHPEHATFKKRLILAKRNTVYGALWEFFQVILCVVACSQYVASTYNSSYHAVRVYNYTEIIYTAFFTIDFVINWFIATNTYTYYFGISSGCGMTWIDVLTIAPVYINMLVGGDKVPINLTLFRFVRILRLIRVLRTFRLLGGLSGIKRQLITLSLTLFSLLFMAAGIIQLVENDVVQQSYHCQYINEFTNYEPYCFPKMNEQNIDLSCDCERNNCRAAYDVRDAKGEPSLIKCTILPFFDCFYFLVVTMATVGYGDIHPTTILSKAVIILFIVTSLIVIPIQVNNLTTLLAMSSTFRNSFSPQNHENHVIICGYVNDRGRLERFFREFFHPVKHFTGAPDFHLVILSPSEPSDDIKSLLFSPLFDSRVTYIIGSALSTEDLRRARADNASAMFFVCNIEVEEQEAFFDDAATVLRTLSVSNFNQNLECFVQVLRPEDRDILKDSDVDVILCLDELKTVLQARNAACPGLSTLVENLFHSFEIFNKSKTNDRSHWIAEYGHGANMEIYYLPLHETYIGTMHADWSLMAEGIYVTYGAMLLGVCSLKDHTVIFNPGPAEMSNFAEPAAFFATYNVGILVATSQDAVDQVAFAIGDIYTNEKIMARMIEVEADFLVRRFPEASGAPSMNNSGKRSFGTSKFHIQENFKDIALYAKVARANALQRANIDSEERGATSFSTLNSDALPLSPTSAKRGNPRRKSLTPFSIDKLNLSTMESKYGRESSEIENASHLSDHIIVFGCMDNMYLFVSELRRSLIVGDIYHPIVIVSEEEPIKWDKIQEKFHDIYFLPESLTTSQGFNASNVREASAVVLLASRESVTIVEEENLDAETLFSYLKLEQYIPRYVFFTVELTCPNNMAVLNSSIIRRTQKHAQLNRANATKRKKFARSQTATFIDADVVHSQIRGTFSSQKRIAISTSSGDLSKSAKEFIRSNPGRRMSSIDFRREEATQGSESQSFWDIAGTHHILPVFASGRSYVPSSFDTLLCQSFFGSLSPLLCEKLICGQDAQTIYPVRVPTPLTGRIFSDIYRAFQSRYVLVLGIYRAAAKSTRSLLPYVFMNPWAEVIVNSGDTLFAFGNPTNINLCLEEFKVPLQNYYVDYTGGGKTSIGLATHIDAASAGPLQAMRNLRKLSIQKDNEASAARAAKAAAEIKSVMIQKVFRGHITRKSVRSSFKSNSSESRKDSADSNLSRDHGKSGDGGQSHVVSDKVESFASRDSGEGIGSNATGYLNESLKLRADDDVTPDLSDLDTKTFRGYKSRKYSRLAQEDHHRSAQTLNSTLLNNQPLHVLQSFNSDVVQDFDHHHEKDA